MAARFYDLLTDISHRGQYNHAIAHACMAAIRHSSCLHRMPLGKTLAMASFSHVRLPFCVWAYRDCIPETFPVSTELRSLQLATLWRMNKMLEPCCAHVAGDPFVAGCRIESPKARRPICKRCCREDSFDQHAIAVFRVRR